MVSNNKRHTMKAIKNKDMIHPSSRKAQQVMRVVLRKDRLEHRQKVRINNSFSTSERILWFRHAVPEDVKTLTREEQHALIEEYLARYNEEYESLVALHRPGKVRPKAAREDMLAAFIAKERQEYASGFGKLALSCLFQEAFEDWIGAWIHAVDGIVLSHTEGVPFLFSIWWYSL